MEKIRAEVTVRYAKPCFRNLHNFNYISHVVTYCYRCNFLTDAFNTFIQQSLNVEGLPFILTKNSKEALREQTLAMLLLDLKRAEEHADREGWLNADDLEREFGVAD